MVDIDVGGLFSQKKSTKGQSEQHPASSGFFGSKKPVEDTHSAETLHQVNDLSDRLRILEERFTNMRSKTQMTDQTVLSNQKKAMDEIKNINSELMEVRRTVDDMKATIKLIVKELQQCTKREDFQVLKKYIELWEPVNFVTRSELDKLIGNKPQE